MPFVLFRQKKRMYGKINIMLKDSELNRKEIKENLQSVEIGIRGSELFVVGKVDHASGIIVDAKIEHRPRNLTPNSPVATEGETAAQETVWSVETDRDFWQIHLTGYDKDAGTCNNIDVKRSDGTQWHYTLTEEDGPKYPSTDLVFSRAQGYLVPVFKPRKDNIEMQGKRLIAVEPRNQADYIGVVASGIKYSHVNGIEIIVQNAKNHTPSLEGYQTIRAVRASVDNPDYRDALPTKDALQIPLHEVDLHPDLIASADPGTKLRVQNFGIVYVPEYRPPADKGQSLVTLKEYVDTSADGVGFAALYQLFTTRFADHLGTHEPGMNNETVNYPTDQNESYGKPIRVGLIKGEHTWRVIVKDNPKGKFNRDGKAIQAVVGRDFDPSEIDQSPIQVHNLKPVNPNNAREVGTHTNDGLHPVQVYIYEPNGTIEKIQTQTLCDFKTAGDGPAQMALMEWMVHAYGDVFNKVEGEKYFSSDHGTIVFQA